MKNVNTSTICSRTSGQGLSPRSRPPRPSPPPRLLFPPPGTGGRLGGLAGFQRLHELPRPARLERSVAREVRERHELLLRRLPSLSPYLLRRFHLPLLPAAPLPGEGGSLDAVAQGRATCIAGTCRGSHSVFRLFSFIFQGGAALPQCFESLPSTFLHRVDLRSPLLDALPQGFQRFCHLFFLSVFLRLRRPSLSAKACNRLSGLSKNSFAIHDIVPLPPLHWSTLWLRFKVV